MKSAIETISDYPNVASLGISASDLANIKSSNDEPTLRDILEKGIEPRWQNFLSRLDKNISVASSILSKKKMRDKLLAYPISACWEFEIAAYFISKNIGICPEPKTIGNSNVDFLVKLCGIDVFVEAHARRLKKKEEQEYGFAGITRQLEETLPEKIQQNNIPKNLPHPLILAIDGEYAGIDTINVEAAFHQFGLEVSEVSAILLKNRGYHLISNPNASNQLSNEQIKMIL